MDLEIAWTVATKDLSIIRKKKSIFYAVIILPLIMSIGLPAIVWVVEQRGTIPDAILIGLLNAFSFFFVIMASLSSIGISSYSIVGEKVEKSLEPLLATPATDGEILFGKGLAAFIPTIVATYVSVTIFMILTDILTYAQLGYSYYPNLTIALVLFLVTPLAIILSNELNVLVSARVNDVRTASQLGAIMGIPFFVIYILAEIGLISLDIATFLAISAILLAADIALFYLSRTTFRREQILTRWK